MKKTLLLILLSLPLIILGQNKIETENWIKEKFELYGFKEGITTYDYTINFGSPPEYSVPIMVIGEDFQVVNIMSSVDIAIIPIKFISKITVLKGDSYNSNATKLIIYTSESNPISVKTITSNGESVKDYSKYELRLSKDFMKEDYPNRIKKAFDNLVQFSGGRIIEESY
tara:strand:+ start:1438 stop:1947 length:510 start_codon:yes stop_codon:yes gene_type:complete